MSRCQVLADMIKIWSCLIFIKLYTRLINRNTFIKFDKKTLNLIAATDDYTHLHPFDHPLSAGLPPSIIDGKKSVNNNNNVSEAGNGATGNGKIDHRAARGPVQNIPEYHPPYLSQLRKCDRKPETLSNKVVTHVQF